MKQYFLDFVMNIGLFMIFFLAIILLDLCVKMVKVVAGHMLGNLSERDKGLVIWAFALVFAFVATFAGWRL